MKKLFILAAMVLSFGASYGQQYFSRTGMVSFFASTPLEDIKADNNQVYVVIDLEKKQLAFSSLVKGFIFPKELMQEHFNENYVGPDYFKTMAIPLLRAAIPAGWYWAATASSPSSRATTARSSRWCCPASATRSTSPRVRSAYPERSSSSAWGSRSSLPAPATAGDGARCCCGR